MKPKVFLTIAVTEELKEAAKRFCIELNYLENDPDITRAFFKGAEYATQFRQQPTADKLYELIKEQNFGYCIRPAKDCDCVGGTCYAAEKLAERIATLLQSPPQPVPGDREISEACPEDCGPEWIIGAKWMREKLTKGVGIAKFGEPCRNESCVYNAVGNCKSREADGKHCKSKID